MARYPKPPSQAPARKKEARHKAGPLFFSASAPALLQNAELFDVAGLVVDDVHAAGDAGVIGVDGTQDLDRAFRIGDRGVVQQGLFSGAGQVVVAAGTEVPGGRDHELEVVDLAVLDVDPVAQAAAGSVDEANALRFGGHVPILADVEVALGDVLLQIVDHVFGLQAGDQALDTAGAGAAQGGEEGLGADFQFAEHEVDVLDELGMTQAVVDQTGGQRAHFGGLAVVAGSLHPGVLRLVVQAGVHGIGHAGVRMLRGAVLVPGVLDMLFDLGRIKGLDVGDLAIEDDAGLDVPGVQVGLAALRRVFAEAHEVGGAADGSPVLVVAGNGDQVRDVAVKDEVLDVRVQGQEVVDVLVGQAFVAGHATHDGELGVRVLGTEHRHGPSGLDLQMQGVQVVVGGKQVDLGRQDVSRMAAEEVSVGEDAQTTGVDDALDGVLGLLKVFLGGDDLGIGAHGLGDGGGDFSGLVDVGGQTAGDVDEVQGMQMIEMHDVVVHELGGQHQVADDGRVVGQFLVHADGVVDATDGSERVHVGADAAGALGEVLCIAGITAFQDDLQTAEQLGAAADVNDFAIFDHGLNAQVTLDPGDRINYDIVFPMRHRGGFRGATRHIVSSLRILILSALVGRNPNEPPTTCR